MPVGVRFGLKIRWFVAKVAIRLNRPSALSAMLSVGISDQRNRPHRKRIRCGIETKVSMNVDGTSMGIPH